MSNNILIGLGGTGGKVLAAFRRRHFEYFGVADDPTTLVEYLYVDSKPKDIDAAKGDNSKDDDQIWQMRGHSVALANSQVLLLKSNKDAIDRIMTSPNDYKNITSWMGDFDVWKTNMFGQSQNETVAAGQIRRYGRFLLAFNVDKFDEQYLSAVERVKEKGRISHVSQGDLTVHVFVGLAGGTGSGTFLDVISRIRSLDFSDKTKILLYVVPPELEQTTWAQKNYYINGYAALLELNSYLVGAFSPSNISKKSTGNGNKKKIDHTFIITNTLAIPNSDDVKHIDMVKGVPTVIAETVFQTVVLSGDADKNVNKISEADLAQQSNSVWYEVLEAENKHQTYETLFEGYGSPDVRANHFLSFGLKRVSIPKNDITELIKLKIICSGIRQIFCNVWDENVGYSEIRFAENNNFSTVKFDLSSQIDSWGLSDNQLKLFKSTSFIDENNSWTVPGRDFEGRIRAIVNEFEEQINNNKTIDIEELKNKTTTLVDNLYASNYREDQGVIRYFNSYEKSNKLRSKNIVRNIENYFFRKWINSDLGIFQIQMQVEGLIASITKQKREIEKDIISASYIDKLFKNKDIATINFKQEKFRKSWWPRNNNYSFMLNEYKEHTSQYYAEQTRNIAGNYAVSLLTDVINELDNLYNNTIPSILAILEEAEKNCGSKIDATVNTIKLNDEYKDYFDKELHSKIDKILSKEYLKDRTNKSLRQCIQIPLHTDKGSFKIFYDNYSRGRLFNALANEEIGTIELQHFKLIDHAETMIKEYLPEENNFNILTWLYKKYNDVQLKEIISNWVKQSSILASFVAGERIRNNEDNSTHKLVMYLPSIDEDASEEVRKAYKQIVSTLSLYDSNAIIIDTASNSNELTITTGQNLLALREFETVDVLYKTKFLPRLNEGDLNLLTHEIYLENDGSQLWPLHKPTPVEILLSALPYCILAEVLAILTPHTNSDKKWFTFTYKQKEEHKSYEIGNVFEIGNESTINEEKAYYLSQNVANKISILKIDSQIKDIKDKLNQRKDRALEDAQHHVESDSYKRIDRAISQAFKILTY